VWLQERQGNNWHDVCSPPTAREVPESIRLFVDLTKAFDIVSSEGLWSILSKLGCPSKFIKIIRSFHDRMMAHVVENGFVSDPVSNGVKQGYVLAPTPFSLMLATMLFSALSNTGVGITIRYRYDGHFFDLRRVKARTKVECRENSISCFTPSWQSIEQLSPLPCSMVVKPGCCTGNN